MIFLGIINIKDIRPIEHLPQITALIRKLRREHQSGSDWEKFKNYLFENFDQIIMEADTRWLVSILDTFVDHGNEIERRNALLVVQIANFEKLWATYLLMHDVTLNKEKLRKLRRNKIIPLWDGMYSFNINHGDMTNNFFSRTEKILNATPVIEKIYRVIIERMKSNGTTLSNLNKYHRRLFEPYNRRSLFRIIRKKVLYFIKNYRL